MKMIFFNIPNENLARMIDVIAGAQPVLLDGYAEVLDFMARYLKSAGRADVRPRAIMSSAQTLPPASRKAIEEAFGCKVFDKYGSREFSGIAYECEAHAGHHVVLHRRDPPRRRAREAGRGRRDRRHSNSPVHTGILYMTTRSGFVDAWQRI